MQAVNASFICWNSENARGSRCHVRNLPLTLLNKHCSSMQLCKSLNSECNLLQRPKEKPSADEERYGKELREREGEERRKEVGNAKKEQKVVKWISAMTLTHITWSSSVFAFQSQFVCAKMQLSYWPSSKYSLCEKHIL